MFSRFVRDALPKEGVNTLVVEFNYGYKFKTHPEIAEPNSLSEADVKEIVHACRDAHVRLIPEIDLLGHQSWAGKTGALLTAHPEFDETRGKYPGNKGIYCRSYCPLAPGLHKVIFDLMDELDDVCESDAFHCGMDEVFILADPDCPRCKGKSPADLFAGEVNALYDHLKSAHRQMWMWGDRFIDGTTNGLGEWEASAVKTQEAINHVRHDIVICDWHYDNAEPTVGYFAVNGFPVLVSTWRNSDVALKQLAMIQGIRNGANKTMASLPEGFLHTTWCGAGAFVKAYYGDKTAGRQAVQTAQCFKDLFKAVRDLPAASR
jgi:hypothetical protein